MPATLACFFICRNKAIKGKLKELINVNESFKMLHCAYSNIPLCRLN